VTYEHDAAPLTPKLKFQLAMKALTDPVTMSGFGLNAAIYQMADYPSYRQGAVGYGQRLGATFAGGYTKILLGDALLPALFHQDPATSIKVPAQRSPAFSMRWQPHLSPEETTGVVRSIIRTSLATWHPARLRMPTIRSGTVALDS
jgi:hypothetical protein